jgi:selenocysteine-specific elongation factor
VRSLVVGTAGHIDHGKSALVRALTGTDPDRLKEEKERGITIDLGFAHLPLDDDLVVSFIDVPGHERFVRNMLAGAHGIDAAILVVAADESVMPQTREHFHICRLLGIGTGIVALTKCDLADEETRGVAEAEVRELVAGSFLEGAPVVGVSARTGEGLGALRDALRALARRAPARVETGALRLPVDRVFTLRGFGTVVTGTLVAGRLALGDEVEILPSGRRSRARGLQVHGRDVPLAPAGTRVAVNLAGLEVHDLARGDVLAHPGTLRATSMLDVRVSLLPGERPLRDQARLRVHVASAEILGRIRFPGGQALAAGSEGVAQIRLEAPTVASRGDRLILRAYSPATTVGGAAVLDPLPRKRRASEPVDARRVAALASQDPVAAAVALVGEAGVRGIDVAALVARVGTPWDVLEPLLLAREDVVSEGRDPVVLLSRDALVALSRRLMGALGSFHADNPLRAAMPREELKQRLASRGGGVAFDRALGELVSAGEIRLGPSGLALVRHTPTLKPDEQAARAALLAAATEARLTGVEIAPLAQATGKDAGLLDRVARLLVAEGRLRRVGEKTLVHAQALDALKEEVRRRWPAGSRLDVGEFKELTGLTRRFVIPLLEHLDAEHVTRRSGADRFTVSSR